MISIFSSRESQEEAFLQTCSRFKWMLSTLFIHMSPSEPCATNPPLIPVNRGGASCTFLPGHFTVGHPQAAQLGVMCVCVVFSVEQRSVWHSVHSEDEQMWLFNHDWSREAEPSGGAGPAVCLPADLRYVCLHHRSHTRRFLLLSAYFMHFNCLWKGWLFI